MTGKTVRQSKAETEMGIDLTLQNLSSQPVPWQKTVAFGESELAVNWSLPSGLSAAVRSADERAEMYGLDTPGIAPAEPKLKAKKLSKKARAAAAAADYDSSSSASSSSSSSAS